MEKAQMDEWIRREIQGAHDPSLELSCYDPNILCRDCPYALFKVPNNALSGCQTFRRGSDDHKTAACFLAAIHDVET